MARYDTIVIGVGGIGSAACYHLSKRGEDVLGLERFNIPNSMGSSHGATRLIRLAQHEDPAYVPLAERAYHLWRTLEEESGTNLLFETGSLHGGPAGDSLFDRTREACDRHSVTYDVLDGADVNARYPGFNLPDDYTILHQPQGGFVASMDCITAHVKQAQANGAEIHGQEAVIDWDRTDDGNVVRTTAGVYKAERLVVAAGAWSGKLLEGFREFLTPERRVMAWFAPDHPSHFSTETFPVFNIRVNDHGLYGFPVFDTPGFKLGYTPPDPKAINPDHMDRTATQADERRLRNFAEDLFPTGAGPTMRLETCIVTDARDGHFVLGSHPDYPSISIAAGFTGHGFKFASVIGEILAELTINGESEFNLSAFDPARV